VGIVDPRAKMTENDCVLKNTGLLDFNLYLSNYKQSVHVWYHAAYIVTFHVDSTCHVIFCGVIYHYGIQILSRAAVWLIPTSGIVHKNHRSVKDIINYQLAGYWPFRILTVCVPATYARGILYIYYNSGDERSDWLITSKASQDLPEVRTSC
jgi:hypothetical protein